MKRKTYSYLLVFFALFSANLTQAQIAIANTTPVTENFNSMGATLNLPANWKVQGSASPTFAGGTTAVTQQASSGSPNTGGTYNWGSTASERSVGAMTSGTFSSPNSYMAWYRNTNAFNLTQLTVSYNAERYRINTSAASIQFYYSTNGTNWTAVTAGDVAAGNFATGSSTYGYPINTVNVTAFNITGLNIANGGDIYLRWNLNTTGSSSQAITIDDISVTGTFAGPSVAIATAHPAAGNITQSTSDNIIGAVSLGVTSVNATLNSVTLTTAGTFSAADITNFKLWLGTSSNSLSGAVQLGSTITGVSSGGALTATGLSNTINSGTTRYILATASVSGSATAGNTVSIASTSFANIAFATATKTGTDPAPAGNAQTIIALAVPTKLVITSISPSSPLAGNSFNVTVQAQDNSNNPQNVSANTDFTLSTNGNAGTIGGTTTGTIAAGSNSVTVTGVTLPSAGTGATLTATRTAGDVLTAGTSSTFTVLGVADHLTFVGVPSSGASGVALTTFSVQARRADNTVDVNYNGNITVSKASGPGSLSGTTTVAAVSGVAIFSTLMFDAGGAYTLNTTSGSLTSATSGNITISQSPITWNFNTATPSSGTPFANLTVSALSSGNNLGSAPALLDGQSASGGYTGASAGNNAGAAVKLGSLNTTVGTGSTYFEFTLTPASTYYVAMTGFKFGARSTSTGPQAYSIRSSKDNYASDIATGTMSNGGTWTLFNPTVNFNSIVSTPVTFRIFGYNGTGSPGSGTANWRIDDLILTLTVQQCTSPTAFTVTGGGAYCAGGSGSPVGLSDSENGFSYQLKNGSTNIGSPVTGTGNAISFGNLTTAATYSVIATNPAGGCTTNMTGSVAVSITPNPTVTVTSQTAVSCNGGADGTATVGATGGTGFTYNWTPSGGTAATANNLSAGNYTCSVTNSGGCVGTATVAITQPTTITHSISAQTNVSCNGGNDGTATVNATGGTPSYTYSWTPSGGNAATANGLTQGTYTCTITDANGCTATQTVTITEPTALSVSAGNGAVICTGDAAILTASSTGGTAPYTYSWAPGNMTTTTVTVSPTSTATYTLTGVDANGCTNMTTVMVTVNSLPTVSASANPTTVCSGDPSTLTATGAMTYSWNTGASGASVQVGPTVNTTYTVTGTDENGCVNTGTVSVSVITCTGTVAEALSFDGSNDYINGTNSMLPQGIAARSFTAWIKPSQVQTTQTIFSYGGANANQSSTISINGGNLYYSSGSNDMGGTSVCAITPNVWTHVAVTLTNKTVKFYINGTLKYTGTLTTSPATSGTSWTISSATAPFEGLMDEVSVWSTVITTQIAGAMNQEMAAGQTGNIALYHFNQGFAGGTNTTTNTLTDASSTASTGILSGFALTGSSSNWVAPGRAGKTKLKDAYCGITLTDMNTQLLAEVVSNATNFQWEFTDMATSAVYTYTRGNAQNNFYMSYVPQLTYNKTYSVQVRAFVGGAWGTYGEACTVTTPSGSGAQTQLQAAFCGSTLSSMSTQLFCDGLVSTSNYEWEFTDIGTSTVYTYIRGNNQNNFYLSWIPQLTYGKTYSVRVRPNYGGTWGTFGNSCQITTPAFPTTSLQSVCGTMIPSRYTQLFITAVPNAQNYEYEFTDVNTSAVFTVLRGNNQINFYLYMAPQAGLSKTYDVRVRAISGGTPGPYGSVCTITTPATMARLAGDPVATEEEMTFGKNTIAADEPVWNFVVYPNPGVGTFYLESNAENAQVEVYDALGQLVSKEQITGTVHTIKLDENRKGMFYLRVMSNNKILYSTKLINQ